MIDPGCAGIYRDLAATRRILLENPDLPEEWLRETLITTLNACEELLQGLDQARETLKTIAQNLNTRTP
jgi:hypothetical protein